MTQQKLRQASVWEVCRYMFRYLSFGHFQNFLHFFTDAIIILPTVWPQASGAILYPAFRITEIPSAPVSQGIQGAVTEQTAEGFRIRFPMTGKIFAFLILKKIIVTQVLIPPALFISKKI